MLKRQGGRTLVIHPTNYANIVSARNGQLTYISAKLLCKFSDKTFQAK